MYHQGLRQFTPAKHITCGDDIEVAGVRYEVIA